MFSSETTLRVRYSETDQMGYVYYGNYAQYYEVARVDALRAAGLTYKGIEESGVMMPVIRMNCEYIRPARYDDLLRIVTTMKEKPLTRAHFHYEVFNEEGVLLNRGDTILVYIDMKLNKPVRCPELIADKFDKFF